MTNLLMLFYECNGIFVALLSSSGVICLPTGRLVDAHFEFKYSCSRGGIGRRARLRGVWEKSRDGSTPFVSTFRKPVSVLKRAFLFWCMFTVYAISSITRKYRYIGLSSQPEVRIARHNKAQNKTTKPYAPFRLIHTKDFKTRIEARRYEKYLKSGMGREYLDALENSNRER